MGADIVAPEPARALALAGVGRAAGAGAIAAPAAHRSPEALLPARAFENGYAVAFANLDDAPGAPPSLILGSGR